MKNRKINNALLLSFFMLFSVVITAQNTDQYNETIKKVIEKSYQAAVKVWGIDSANGKQNSPQFTGVVVKPEGIILTAAHAINPEQYYQVTFPDGKTVRAQAKGKMGIRSMQGRPDIGMLVITDVGTYPYAEMGWSSSMKVNDLCVSIAYPTTLDLDKPTIRIGKITNPLDPWGFLVSTCKMEPGDSGGPLFDSLGRVIAIHSRIAIDEDVNYESPINLFREYWDSLLQPVNYSQLPTDKQQIASDNLKDKLVNVVNEEPFSLKAKGTVQIFSQVSQGKPLALGTHIMLDEKYSIEASAFTWIVTKSSLIKEPVSVKIDGNLYEAEIYVSDISNDLSLLKIKKVNSEGISKLQVINNFETIGVSLFSETGDMNIEFSSLGSNVFEFSKKPAKGFFGAGANFINEKIIITNFSPNSPAQKAGLQLQDEVKFINNIPVTQPQHYGRELMQYEVGDSISIKGLRNGEVFNYTVVLEEFPLSNHPANKFEGGRSERFDNFKAVFTHDAKLKPNQCGGPVYRTDGTFMGVNIARFSRISSLAVPANVVFDFVEHSISDKI